MTKAEIRRLLIKTNGGHYHEWRRACEIARDNGWTYDEVIAVHRRCTAVFVAIWVVLVFVVGCLLALSGCGDLP